MFDFNSKIEGTFPAERPMCSPLENHEHTKHEMNEVVKRLLAFEERIQDEFNSMLRQITKDNTIFKDTYASSYSTFAEAVKNEINAFESNVDNTITLFTTSIEGKYSEVVDKKIEELIKSIGESFTDFQTKLTTDINMFEATVNKNISNFTSSQIETNRLFRETVDSILTERIDAQDIKVNDAVAYLKTNLTASLRAEISDMYERGELDAIVNEAIPYGSMLLVDSVTDKVYNVYVNNGEMKMEDTGKTSADYSTEV